MGGSCELSLNWITFCTYWIIVVKGIYHHIWGMKHSNIRVEKGEPYFTQQGLSNQSSISLLDAHDAFSIRNCAVWMVSPFSLLPIFTFFSIDCSSVPANVFTFGLHIFMFSIEIFLATRFFLSSLFPFQSSRLMRTKKLAFIENGWTKNVGREEKIFQTWAPLRNYGTPFRSVPSSSVIERI